MFKRFSMLFMSVLLVFVFNFNSYANNNLEETTTSDSFMIDENGSIIQVDTSYDYSLEKEMLIKQLEEEEGNGTNGYYLGGGYSRTTVEVYGVNNYATKSTDAWRTSSLFNNTENAHSITAGVQYSNSASYSYNFSLTSGELSTIKSVAFGIGVANSATVISSVTMTVPAGMYGWLETRPVYVNKWGYVVTNHYTITGAIHKTERKYFDVYYPSTSSGQLNVEYRTKTSRIRPI